MLIPAYRPRVKLVRPVKKQVRVWSEESISTPQDCMEITNWNIFREAATLNDHTDLQEYTMTKVQSLGLYLQMRGRHHHHQNNHCALQPETMDDR